MTDALFQDYQSRALASRDAVIITQQARDADPLTCQEGRFTTRGALTNWVFLP